MARSNDTAGTSTRPPNAGRTQHKPIQKPERAHLDSWKPRALQAVSKVFMGLFSYLRFRITVTGQEHLWPTSEDSQPVLVVCNHSSGWDIPILTYHLRWRLLSYMAKQELWYTAFGRWYYTTVCAVAVNRAKMEVSTLRSCKTVLHTPGWALVIFPEGTRHKGGNLDEMKQGAAVIAAMNKVPVLPVAISYSADGKRAGMSIQPMLPVIEKETAEALGERIKAALHQAKLASEALAG
jgi:1-acyl-sn-glycerol-3-phosphate acyltransferase